MFRSVAVSVVLLLVCTLTRVYSAAAPSRMIKEPACRVCHTYEDFATDNLCYRPAARMHPEGMAIHHGPGFIVLDMLKNGEESEDLFGPVPFNHAAHSGMTGSCSVCHHETPENQEHPECRSCHELQLEREDVRKPGLKGAYHRQCMGCHREWAHEDHCEMCHMPEGDSSTVIRPTSPEIYMAEKHPVVAKPEFEIYETEIETGVKTKIVFNHNDHTELYGYQCVDCHKQDNCLRCHENGKQHTQKIRTIEEHHQPCSTCHQIADVAEGEDIAGKNCEYCHRKSGQAPPPRFDHGQTGWLLEPYHQSLNCRECHQEVPFSSVNTNCNTCHAVPTTGTDGRCGNMVCVNCHDPHEPWYEYIQKENATDLCLVCHDDLAGGPPGQMHPMGQMDRPVPQAWVQVNEPVSTDGNELTCLSCHSTTSMRFSPLSKPESGPDDLCLACHPQQATVFGSLHDIRSEYQHPSDGADVTSRDAGTCRTCHPSHQIARKPVPTASDPNGICTPCHQPRGWAQAKLAPAVSHPETACMDCHNPHESEFGNFLTKSEDELCTECHAEQARLAGGPHDLSHNPNVWPKPEKEGLCLPCHIPHGNEKKGLLRFTMGEQDFYHDDTCLVCHHDAGWDADSDIAIIHPHQIAPDQDKVELALVPIDDSGNMRMGCRTCHDPHGGNERVHLARGVAPDMPAEELCLHCHVKKRYIKQTGHSTACLQEAGLDADSCKPCHAMHAKRNDSWGLMLSPRFLPQVFENLTDPSSDCAPCQSCHHPDGPAPMRKVAAHPKLVPPNIISPETAGYLPLFDSSGHVNVEGQVTCRTCHLSHGRLDLLQLADENENLSEQKRHAMKLNLRTFVTPNICTHCHGQEGRLRFLMFHDPDFRKKLSSAHDY